MNFKYLAQWLVRSMYSKILDDYSSSAIRCARGWLVFFNPIFLSPWTNSCYMPPPPLYQVRPFTRLQEMALGQKQVYPFRIWPIKPHVQLPCLLSFSICPHLLDAEIHQRTPKHQGIMDQQVRRGLSPWMPSTWQTSTSLTNCIWVRKWLWLCEATEISELPCLVTNEFHFMTGPHVIVRARSNNLKIHVWKISLILRQIWLWINK